MTERLLLALILITLVTLFAPRHTHASGNFEEKFYLSRGCPGYWMLDSIDQDESSVTMRCEESQ